MTADTTPARSATPSIHISDWPHLFPMSAPKPTPAAAPTANDRQVGGTHYKDKAIQPWDAMEQWMTPEEFRGFLRGNAIKYLARTNDKGGTVDLRKAQHYIDKLLEVSP